jgi:hypothetical protein
MLFYIPKYITPTKRNANRVLVRSSERKRPLGRPRSGWDDIAMVLRETGRNGMDCINLAHDETG